MNWAHLVCLAVGRKVIHDDEPGMTLKLVRDILSFHQRSHQFVRGDFAIWNDCADRFWVGCHEVDLNVPDVTAVYGVRLGRGPDWLTEAYLDSGGELPAGKESLLLATVGDGRSAQLVAVGAW